MRRRIVAAFAMRPFLPTPRQTNLLILLGFCALGAGLYLRHSILDAAPLATACLAGMARGSCVLRRFLVELYELQFFGGVALIAAAAHFIRPRAVVFAAALAAAILGLFLHNVVPSAFAVSILVMAFARTPRVGTRKTRPAAPPQTTRPASSRTTH